MDSKEKAVIFCALQISMGKIRPEDIKSKELKELAETYLQDTSK